MLIYLITFSLSLILIYLGLDGKFVFKDKKYKFTKIQKNLLIVIGLILPCLLASLRNITVGSDTKNYINIIFNMAKQSENFIDFITIEYINDIGFSTLSYVSSKLFGDFQIFLFILELFVVVPIFASLKKNCKNKDDVIIGMLLFYLLFYNNSFSIIRQTISLSFVTMGITYLLKNEKYKSFLFLAIAIMFHKTAAIVLLLYGFYFLCKKIKNKKKERIIKYCIYILSIIFVLSFKYIILFLHDTGLYKHGIEYLIGYQKFDFSFVDTFTYFAVVIIIYIKKRVLIPKKVNYDFYYFVAIESLIILQIGMFFETLERISLYLFFPLIINCVSKIKTRKKRDIKTFLFVGYVFAYWILIFVILKINDTIPYEFFWKG